MRISSIHHFAFLFVFFHIYTANANINKISLTLEQAVKKTVQSNPSLTSYRHLLEGVEGDIVQSRVGSRTTIDLEVENAIGSGQFVGLKQSQTTLNVTWILDGDLINAREDRAKKKKSLIDIESQVKALNVCSQTAALFIQSLKHQEKLAIIKQWTHDAISMFKKIQRSSRMGKSSIADLSLAEAELSLIQLELEDVQHEIKTAFTKLAAQWGEGSPRFEVVAGSLAQINDLPEFDELKKQIYTNPNLEFFIRKERIAQSEISLAQSESKTRWSFNAGARFSAESNDLSIVGGLSIPLGSQTRSKGKVASLNSAISAYRAEASALRNQFEADLFEFYQAFEHALHSINVLSTKTIPALEMALRQSRKAYELGSASLLNWAEIQKKVFHTRMMLVDAYFLAHFNRIEIERLSGMTLAGNPISIEEHAINDIEY